MNLLAYKWRQIGKVAIYNYLETQDSSYTPHSSSPELHFTLHTHIHTHTQPPRLLSSTSLITLETLPSSSDPLPRALFILSPDNCNSLIVLVSCPLILNTIHSPQRWQNNPFKLQI